MHNLYKCDIKLHYGSYTPNHIFHELALQFTIELMTFNYKFVLNFQQRTVNFEKLQLHFKL